MHLVPQRRRSRVLAVLALLLALVGGALVVATRADVTWTAQVDGGVLRVRDWDEDRLLVETTAEELVVLDRADGAERGRLDLPADQVLEQAALVPGGYVVQWTSRAPEDGITHVARVADDGTEQWRRRESERLRVLGVLADAGIVAVYVPGARGETLRGLSLDDGQVRWSREVAAHGRTLADGPLLRSTSVVLAQVGREDAGSTVLDLADGSPLGDLDVAADSAGVCYWRDVVLVVDDDDRLVRSVAGTVAPLDGVDQVGGPLLTGHVVEGMVQVDSPDGAWTVDLEAGTVVAAPDRPPYDGSPYTGPTVREDSALLAERPGRLTAWRHRLSASDALRLTVVDAEGEHHGDLVADRDEVVWRRLLDQHEAVVVVVDDDGRRLVLLGR